MNNSTVILKKSHSQAILLYVGIDGGATHCRASIYDENRQLLGHGKAGPANPVNGFLQTQNSIIDAIKRGLSVAGIVDFPLGQLVVGAGLAGLHLPSQQKTMAQWQHPFRSLHLSTDLHAALLGAHEGGDGGVIILGTGFSALGVVKDRQIPIGGYGFPINATCSGAWFGLELVKAVLLDADGVGQRTSLTEAVLTHIDVIALAEKMNNAPAQDFAAYAPLVFEHAALGDGLAINLIKHGSQFVNRVIQKLLDHGVTQIAFIGGIAPHILTWLDKQYLPVIVAAQSTPENGTMLWAKKKFESINNQ